MRIDHPFTAYRFVIAIAFICCHNPLFISLAYCFDKHISFRHLTVRSGLSQSAINAIFQDSSGNLWIGTEDGLNRFDGYKFEHFKHDPQNTNSLLHSWIWDISEDWEGNLWVATWAGLCKMNPAKTHITRYEPIDGDSTSLSNFRTDCLLTDHNGALWTGTWGEMDVNPTWKPGIHLGGFLTYDEFLPIVLEAGLFFSMKGCKYKGEMYDYEGGTGGTYNLVRIKDLKYIDIPLLARYYINENLSVFAGPEFAFLLSAKVRDKPEGGETEVIDVMDEYKGFDFLLALGVAYMLNNGVQIQLQYDHGLSNISDYGQGGQSYYTIKNRVIKLSVGIMLSKLTGGSKD